MQRVNVHQRRRLRAVPHLLFVAIPLGVFLLGAPVLRADDIIRTTGDPYESVTVTGATWESVTYRKEGISSRQNVPADDVEDIRWTSESSTLSRGRGALAAGEFSRAVSAFRAATTDLNALHALNAQFMLGLSESGWASTDPSHLSAAVTALQTYVQTGKPAKHFYVPHAILALSDAHIRARDFSKATQVLGDLTGGQMGRKWVEAANLKKAQALLAQEKYAEARDIFRDVQGSTNPGFALEARIGYAQCQVGQKQFPGAVETLGEFLGEGRNEKNTSPPRYGELRARAWIVYGQAEEGGALGDREKLQWAAIRYHRAASVGVAGGDVFAEALFRAKGIYQQLGQTDRAEILTQKLNQLCPSSAWNRP